MEHELRKHIKGVLTEVIDRKKPFWKRVSEIIIDCLIIVFAVTFAVFMEKQREHDHEQEKVKEFLLGLKTDLSNDIREMNEDKETYQDMHDAFLYLGKRTKMHADSIKKYEWVVWNSVGLILNAGRYDGFKASGKLDAIENAELRNAILDLYEETMVGLVNNTNAYSARKKDLEKIVVENSENIQLLAHSHEVFKTYCRRFSFVDGIVGRYNKAIRESNNIIELIDKEYYESK